MILKEEILKLKSQGMSQKEIAKILNCSSSTVSYHSNPFVRQKAIKLSKEAKIRNKSLSKPINPYIDKEIISPNIKVSWKHAEAIVNARLIELGYETFLPFNGGGEIDIIASKDNELKRIQIKSKSCKSRSVININLERNSINYKRHIPSLYINIDWYMIFDGVNIYKIDFNENLKKNIHLRYKAPKNFQKDSIRMAKDYIF